MEKTAKNQIKDYISEAEVKKLDLDFQKFLASPSAPKKAERKININRFKQTLQSVFSAYFVLPDIFRNYFSLLFSKNYPLRSMEIGLTYECNGKCDQCSCRSAHDPNKKRLNLDEFKKAIDDSIKLGAFQFNITGGEPLLYHQECLELIKYIRSKGKYVHLCTNAFLMNDDLTQELKKAGLNSIEMGLDSADEKTHDSNRGTNSYQKVMEAVESAKKAGIK